MYFGCDGHDSEMENRAFSDAAAVGVVQSRSFHTQQIHRHVVQRLLADLSISFRRAACSCPEALLPPRQGRNIEIRLIDEQDEVIGQFPRPAEAIKERFRQGAKCLVAFKEGQFVGFLWLLLGSYQEDEVRALYTPLPKERTAWDFDVYVEPGSRLGFTFLRLWDEANHFLKHHDIAWSCSRISAFNAGSLSAHARLGTVRLGSAIFFYAGRWQVTLASLSPYFHLSSYPGSFPEFRLDTRKLGKT